MHTTFIVDICSVEMFEWLQDCGASIVITGGEMEMVDINLGPRSISIPGRKNPIVITIKDEDIALMFRVKYPESRVVKYDTK